MSSLTWPKFPSAKQSIVIDSGLSFDDIITNPSYSKTIDTHHFNHQVKLILPFKSNHSFFTSSNFEKDYPILSQILTNNTPNCLQEFNYFLLYQVPVHLLIHTILIEYYLKKGSLSVASINTSIKFDNCLCLSPNGILTLSLNESTYHRCGLSGLKSIITRSKTIVQKYIIEIDLKSSLCASTSSRYYQRLFRLLRNCNLKFDIYLKWTPYDTTISPSSIVQFFNFIKNDPGANQAYFLEKADANSIIIKECQPRIRSFDKKWSSCPKELELPFSQKNCNSGPNFLLQMNIIDWVEATLSEIETDYKVIDPEVSSFSFEDDSIHLSLINGVELIGFFDSNFVKRLLIELETFLNQIGNECLQFVGLAVFGFEDCPVSWEGKRNEHGSKINGENMYGLFLRRSDQCMIWRKADEYDFGIEKL